MTMLLFSEGVTHGPVFEFLVVFAVVLFGPVVFTRFGLPGLIGVLLGGFVIGPHGLGLVHAGDQTVPELGQLGLLYLMFVAGLELDLHVLKQYRRAAVLLGLLAFLIPGVFGIAVGLALGWARPAFILLGALLASHTLIVYPRLREAGVGGNRAVATAVGATVLTDTLALVVLALVAGTQTGSGSIASIVGKIVLGFVVLTVAALFVLPRGVDLALRRWGADQVARYLLIIVSLLGMALLAQAFGIEGIVGAFFAGMALNRLVPNEGVSMERIEFFGNAVFVPIFLVSIGLLLDPSVMFTAEALKLAGLICAAALIGKGIACWVAGSVLGFTMPERAAMYVLTVPQAAATLAVTLIGFEIGLFGTTVVNAVLVLILVSISLSAFLTERVVRWMPAHDGHALRLGERVLVVATAGGPSDYAVRLATRLSRPDGGHSDILITRTADDPKPDTAHLRAVYRHGFDGHVRTEIDALPSAVAKAVLNGEHSLVIVDDPSYGGSPGAVPVLVVAGDTISVVVNGDGPGSVVEEVQRRLAKNEQYRVVGVPT